MTFLWRLFKPISSLIQLFNAQEVIFFFLSLHLKKIIEMLGRRQIREKVVCTLYANYQNPIAYDELQKRMLLGIERIYNLYIYELNFLVALKQLAEQQIEIGKTKFLKDENKLHPNAKFINNSVLGLIEENYERLSYTSKHQELKWDLHDEFLVKTFKKIVAGKRFQDHVSREASGFQDEQKFIGKLFLRYIAENDDLHDILEDKELSWADDIHIANSMVQKTIGALKEGENPHTLIKMIKNEADETFATKLLWESIKNWKTTEEKIAPLLKNWELNRVSLMDRVILVTAITELDYFPQTPSRIIINEFIEIAKVYATDKSNIFVNGILDQYTKEKQRL